MPGHVAQTLCNPHVATSTVGVEPRLLFRCFAKELFHAWLCLYTLAMRKLCALRNRLSAAVGLPGSRQKRV